MAPAQHSPACCRSDPQGRLWAEPQASRAFCVQQKAGLRLCSPPPEVLTLGFPRYLSSRERTGGSAIG